MKYADAGWFIGVPSFIRRHAREGGHPVNADARDQIERARRTGSSGPVYANRLRPKADFGESRGFDAARARGRAGALAEAASRTMTVVFVVR